MLEALDPAWLPTNIDTVRVQLDPHEMSGEVLHRTSHAAVRQAQPRWRSARVPPDGGGVGQEGPSPSCFVQMDIAREEDGLQWAAALVVPPPSRRGLR